MRKHFIQGLPVCRYSGSTCYWSQKSTRPLFYKLKLGQPEICSCDTAPVTTEHLLWTALFSAPWSKGWYMARKQTRGRSCTVTLLKRTAAFVTATGMDIWKKLSMKKKPLTDSAAEKLLHSLDLTKKEGCSHMHTHTHTHLKNISAWLINSICWTTSPYPQGSHQDPTT